MEKLIFKLSAPNEQTIKGEFTPEEINQLIKGKFLGLLAYLNSISGKGYRKSLIWTFKLGNSTIQSKGGKFGSELLAELYVEESANFAFDGQSALEAAEARAQSMEISEASMNEAAEKAHRFETGQNLRIVQATE